MISLREWLLNYLQASPEDDLGGYPYGIVIDGYCNYAVEKTILYDSEMHILGVRWTDPTGDISESFGHPFRVIYNKDYSESVKHSQPQPCPDVV